MLKATCKLAELLILVVFVAAMGGCYVKSPKYPEAWPKLESRPDIERRIAGVYQCQGEIVENQTGMWPMTSLSSFLIGGRDPQSCDTLEIRFLSPDKLQLRYLAAGTETVVHTYAKGEDYRVAGGWIEFRSQKFKGNANIGFVYSSDRPFLTINAERDLVVKMKNSEVGVILVVPAGTWGTEWGRFTRVSE